jgi:phosphatidylglycerophosphatase A
MILWLAQGLGLGRIPVAPGTFGSLGGLLWFGLLLASGSAWIFLSGLIAGLALSVWLCGAGEKILRQKDPASVVVDEIAAMPGCFLGWVVLLCIKTGRMPAAEHFVSATSWFLTLGVFLAFRFFDIVKPWPVRQSQALPGGWGVTVDDLLAGVYVNVVVLFAYVAGVGGGRW